MKITLTNTGKRFNREWIFRHINQEFLPDKTYAITGPNGSGKSTLLQVIAGAVMQSEGSVAYLGAAHAAAPQTLAGKSFTTAVPDILAHRQLAFSAPYLELIEEMTATELLNFHTKFKNLVVPIPSMLEQIGLEKSAHKQIRYFSSGMKQRLKLAQAFFSEASVLLLDEPLTNLDQEGIDLYHRLISDYATGKLVIVSSNDKEEYAFCETVISMADFKSA